MISTLLQLYSNPTTLLHRSGDQRRVWFRLEIVSVVILLAVSPALIGVATLSGRLWPPFVAYAVFVLIPLMIAVAVAQTIAGPIRLWLLYLYGPPSAVMALLSGLIPIMPIGWVLSWSLGMPLLLGALFSSVCAAWVDTKLGAIARDRTRNRPAGADSALPALDLQRRARRARLIGAVASSVVALVALILFVGSDPVTSVAIATGFLAFAGACLRLDATLLCLIGRPMVTQGDHDGPQATYAGRWSLFTPSKQLRRLLIGGPSLTNTGAAIVALLHEGTLGPSIRRACRLLVPEQAHRLAFSISSQPGGADTLRYLAPAFPLQVRDIALTYARLAEETHRPRDLQRWLAALVDRPGIADLVSAGFAPDLGQALALARETLTCYSHDQLPAHAADVLRQAIYSHLPPNTSRQLAANAQLIRWPEALLERVEAHERMLRLDRLTDLE